MKMSKFPKYRPWALELGRWNQPSIENILLSFVTVARPQVKPTDLGNLVKQFSSTSEKTGILFLSFLVTRSTVDAP